MLFNNKSGNYARNFAWVLTLSITLLLGTVATVRADGNPDDGWTRVEETIPFGEVAVNACYLDEFVTLNGQLFAVTKTKVQPDGTTSIKQDGSVSATGVGSSSGTEYTVTDNTATTLNGLSSLPFSYTLDRISKLIGDGVPDMYLHYRSKLTLNADGTITHDMSDIKLVCNP